MRLRPLRLRACKRLDAAAHLERVHRDLSRIRNSELSIHHLLDEITGKVMRR